MTSETTRGTSRRATKKPTARISVAAAPLAPPPGAEGVEEVYVRIARQAGRLADARAAVFHERERLERMLAEAVSSKPEAETWYAHPGLLTLDQACGAASVTELQLHRAMARYRAAGGDGRPRQRRRAARPS